MSPVFQVFQCLTQRILKTNGQFIQYFPSFCCRNHTMKFTKTQANKNIDFFGGHLFVSFSIFCLLELFLACKIFQLSAHSILPQEPLGSLALGAFLDCLQAGVHSSVQGGSCWRTPSAPMPWCAPAQGTVAWRWNREGKSWSLYWEG